MVKIMNKIQSQEISMKLLSLCIKSLIYMQSLINNQKQEILKW